MRVSVFSLIMTSASGSRSAMMRRHSEHKSINVSPEGEHFYEDEENHDEHEGQLVSDKHSSNVELGEGEMSDKSPYDMIIDPHEVVANHPDVGSLKIPKEETVWAEHKLPLSEHEKVAKKIQDTFKSAKRHSDLKRNMSGRVQHLGKDAQYHYVGDHAFGGQYGSHGSQNAQYDSNGNLAGSGHYDSNGQWVANGQYDSNGNLAGSGHYDSNGQWVANGQYDSNGNLAGSGHYDSNGQWVANSGSVKSGSLTGQDGGYGGSSGSGGPGDSATAEAADARTGGLTAAIIGGPSSAYAVGYEGSSEGSPDSGLGKSSNGFGNRYNAGNRASTGPDASIRSSFDASGTSDPVTLTKGAATFGTIAGTPASAGVGAASAAGAAAAETTGFAAGTDATAPPDAAAAGTTASPAGADAATPAGAAAAGTTVSPAGGEATAAGGAADAATAGTAANTTQYLGAEENPNYGRAKAANMTIEDRNVLALYEVYSCCDTVTESLQPYARIWKKYLEMPEVPGHCKSVEFQANCLVNGRMKLSSEFSADNDRLVERRCNLCDKCFTFGSCPYWFPQQSQMSLPLIQRGRQLMSALGETKDGGNGNGGEKANGNGENGNSDGESDEKTENSSDGNSTNSTEDEISQGEVPQCEDEKCTSNNSTTPNTTLNTTTPNTTSGSTDKKSLMEEIEFFIEENLVLTIMFLIILLTFTIALAFHVYSVTKRKETT